MLHAAPMTAHSKLMDWMTIVTYKAHCYAKVIEEMNFGNGSNERIRHVDRNYLNNRIEADHATLKQPMRPKRSFRKLTGAKTRLKASKPIAQSGKVILRTLRLAS